MSSNRLLPSRGGAETYIAEQLDVVDPQRVHAVRESMREQMASALQDESAAVAS